MIHLMEYMYISSVDAGKHIKQIIYTKRDEMTKSQIFCSFSVAAES
jgi:hypothetical protein